MQQTPYCGQLSNCAPKVGDLQADLADLALQGSPGRGAMPAVAAMEVDPDLQDNQQPSQDQQGGVENRGEQGNLADWLDPVVPGPVVGLAGDDADGWCRIDMVGAWDCALCQF